MAKDGMRQKYLQHRVPEAGPLRRKALQRIYDLKRIMVLFMAGPTETLHLP